MRAALARVNSLMGGRLLMLSSRSLRRLIENVTQTGEYQPLYSSLGDDASRDLLVKLVAYRLWVTRR